MKQIHLLIKTVIIATAAFLFAGCSRELPSRPNILLIVADDLNYDSPGFAGGVAPDVTPNIDRLAGEGFLFKNAFVTVSVCQPSRQSMLSGLIPVHYGSEGFFPMKAGIPTLPSLLSEAGYITGNIHKKHHMMPRGSFPWDYDNERLGLTNPDGVVGRDPEAIAGALRKLITMADRENKPFFVVVNSADPHRPFHGDKVQPGSWFWGDEEVTLKTPSRIYTPDEVNVPPALPDLPGIREDLAKYASSVRRLDDTVGECLEALNSMGKDSSTLVIFVSDNGMPLPFAKFDCYLASNRTPLIMRWPGLLQTPAQDEQHLVSLMDITPTVLEIAGVPAPENLDGMSLVPILENSSPENWRESIVFIRNEDIYYPSGIRSGSRRNPDFVKDLERTGWRPRPDHPERGTYSREKEIRTYYDGRYGYIYNHWYREDGLELGPLGACVPYSDPSLNAMRQAAALDEKINKRYRYYLLRGPEELYDWSADPGSKHNLINDPDFSNIVSKARAGLLYWMQSSNDPVTPTYEKMIKEFENTN